MMSKNKVIKRILLILNSILVSILSAGAAYFGLLPLIFGWIELDRIGSAATQNEAIKGLWIFYFSSIVFLIASRKFDNKILYLSNIAFLTIFIFFVLLITGMLSQELTVGFLEDKLCGFQSFLNLY